MPESYGNDVHEAWLATLLAWVAGFVDAVGYLALAHVFVANMTGNTVVGVADLAQRNWGSAWHRAFPIPVFVVGAAVGATAIEVAHRQRWRSAHAVAFGLEVVLLVAFALVAQPLLANGALPLESGWLFYALAALPTLAMGLQSASFRRVGSNSVRTTYVSGILTAMAEEAVFSLFRRAGRAPETDGRHTGSERRQSPNRVLLPAGIWISYAFGAILGAFLHEWWELGSLALPIGTLIFVAIWDLAQPDTPVRSHAFAPPAEHEQ